jgi:toxin-antitoxin system PIN domain toxin
MPWMTTWALMYCVDVNILVHSYSPSSPDHRPCREWLEQALVGVGPIALPMAVLSGFWRVVTHRRIFDTPTRPERAVAFTDWLLAHPITFVPAIDAGVYALSQRLILDQRLTGNDIPDAVLAATALELRATLVTADRGFRRFADLSIVDPTSH